MAKAQQSNSQIAKAKSTRPYKSRSQRPCDFCRRRKTCCIIEGTIPCTPCIQFNQGKCTFQEGPMKRNNKNDIKNIRANNLPPSLPPIAKPSSLELSIKHSSSIKGVGGQAPKSAKHKPEILLKQAQLQTQPDNAQIQAKLLKSPNNMSSTSTSAAAAASASAITVTTATTTSTGDDSYALWDKSTLRHSIATKKVPILKSEAKNFDLVPSYSRFYQQRESYPDSDKIPLTISSEFDKYRVNATEGSDYIPQTINHNTNRTRMRHSCSSLVLEMKGTSYMDFIHKPEFNDVYMKSEVNEEIHGNNITMFLAENSDLDSNYAGVNELHIPVDFGEPEQNSFKSTKKDTSHTPTLELDFLSVSSIANVSPLEDNVSTFGINYHAPQFNSNSGVNDIDLIGKANEDLEFMNKPNELGGVEEQWNLYLPSETDIFTLMSL